jgi:hypothetical protein
MLGFGPGRAYRSTSSRRFTCRPPLALLLILITSATFVRRVQTAPLAAGRPMVLRRTGGLILAEVYGALPQRCQTSREARPNPDPGSDLAEAHDRRPAGGKDELPVPHFGVAAISARPADLLGRRRLVVACRLRAPDHSGVGRAETRTAPRCAPPRPGNRDLSRVVRFLAELPSSMQPVGKYPQRQSVEWRVADGWDGPEPNERSALVDPRSSGGAGGSPRSRPVSGSTSS